MAKPLGAGLGFSFGMGEAWAGLWKRLAERDRNHTTSAAGCGAAEALISGRATWSAENSAPTADQSAAMCAGRALREGMVKKSQNQRAPAGRLGRRSGT